MVDITVDANDLASLIVAAEDVATVCNLLAATNRTYNPVHVEQAVWRLTKAIRKMVPPRSPSNPNPIATYAALESPSATVTEALHELAQGEADNQPMRREP